MPSGAVLRVDSYGTRVAIAEPMVSTTSQARSNRVYLYDVLADDVLSLVWSGSTDGFIANNPELSNDEVTSIVAMPTGGRVRIGRYELRACEAIDSTRLA